MKSKDTLVLLFGIALIGAAGYAIYYFTQPAAPTTSYKPDETIFKTPTASSSSGSSGGFDLSGILSIAEEFI